MKWTIVLCTIASVSGSLPFVSKGGATRALEDPRRLGVDASANKEESMVRKRDGRMEVLDKQKVSEVM